MKLANCNMMLEQVFKRLLNSLQSRPVISTYNWVGFWNKGMKYKQAGHAFCCCFVKLSVEVDDRRWTHEATCKPLFRLLCEDNTTRGKHEK